MTPPRLGALLCTPELAVLYSLDAALEASALALAAAHPDLEASDFAAAPVPPSPQTCLADALLIQVEALRRSLLRYRTLAVMQDLWARQGAIDLA